MCLVRKFSQKKKKTSLALHREALFCGEKLWFRCQDGILRSSRADKLKDPAGLAENSGGSPHQTQQLMAHRDTCQQLLTDLCMSMCVSVGRCRNGVSNL